MRFQPLDLDVRRLVLGRGRRRRTRRASSGSASPARCSASSATCTGGLRARLIGAGALQRRWPGRDRRNRPAACSRRSAARQRSASLSENSSAPNEVAGVGQADAPESPAPTASLASLGMVMRAFQQRIGRVHLEMHERRTATDAAVGGFDGRIILFIRAMQRCFRQGATLQICVLPPASGHARRLQARAIRKSPSGLWNRRLTAPEVANREANRPSSWVPADVGVPPDTRTIWMPCANF